MPLEEETEDGNTPLHIAVNRLEFTFLPGVVSGLYMAIDDEKCKLSSIMSVVCIWRSVLPCHLFSVYN